MFELVRKYAMPGLVGILLALLASVWIDPQTPGGLLLLLIAGVLFSVVARELLRLLAYARSKAAVGKIEPDIQAEVISPEQFPEPERHPVMPESLPTETKR